MQNMALSPYELDLLTALLSAVRGNETARGLLNYARNLRAESGASPEDYTKFDVSFSLTSGGDSIHIEERVPKPLDPNLVKLFEHFQEFMASLEHKR